MDAVERFRTGRYVRQPTGYRAFLPAALPFDPPVRLDDGLWELLSEADRALARLDAAAEFLPNPDLFVAMYVRKEAVLSAQIEGTQASMVDLLEHEAGEAEHAPRGDVSEVVNYVAAINRGLARLEELPLSLRLIQEIHALLLDGVRGGEKTPGEFRRSQNWIGAAGCTLNEATFIPPPPDALLACLGDLERFLHDETPMPVLLKAALAHLQFETIHPFLDGNGRMGRLLITFFLCWRGVLRWPSLYLSWYFKQHRLEYYDRLQSARDDGDLEGWVRFFLQGVKEVSADGAATAGRIQQLRDEHRALVAQELSGTGTGFVLLDHLMLRPYVGINNVAAVIDRTYATANQLVNDFERLGLLREVTGQKRNRRYAYQPYVDIFGELRP